MGVYLILCSLNCNSPTPNKPSLAPHRSHFQADAPISRLSGIRGPHCSLAHLPKGKRRKGKQMETNLILFLDKGPKFFLEGIDGIIIFQ